MAPFRSKAQMRGAFSGAFGKKFQQKAEKWAGETPKIDNLPEHVTPKKVKQSIIKKLIKNKKNEKNIK